jgi:hypothetical protein
VSGDHRLSRLFSTAATRFTDGISPAESGCALGRGWTAHWATTDRPERFAGVAGAKIDRSMNETPDWQPLLGSEPSHNRHCTTMRCTAGDVHTRLSSATFGDDSLTSDPDGSRDLLAETVAQ